MKICIFGASSATIDQTYITEVERLAETMARRGHSLVFGAGATGAMGAAARGTKRGGGFIQGVIPEFFREEGVERIYPECDLLTFTDSMAQRKTMMEDLADAFIIAPGGIGTLEEFFEVITLKQLGRAQQGGGDIQYIGILRHAGKLHGGDGGKVLPRARVQADV